MSDLAHMKIADIDAIDGVLEGISFHKAAAGLGVSAFGISIIDLAPGAGDHAEPRGHPPPGHRRHPRRALRHRRHAVAST